SNAVTVYFSEKMSNTIENLQAFKLNGSVFPNSISPASQYSYLLTFRDEISVGLNELSVSGLRDLYGSSIEAAIDSFYMDSVIVSSEFFIASFKILDSYNLKITFNLEVEEQSAGNVDNYIFDPDNKASSISVSTNDSKTINISLKGEKPIGSVGREYVLRLQDVYSSASTGNLKINEGAGSYIVLSSYANDLSEVYAYPNPVNPSNGEQLTFAKLPQYAQITIWSIEGKKIGEVEENDGNGGASFDLMDMNGNLLPTGIYFYRVAMTDDKNNEQDEKLGKFAVIR
ncbi:MAG: T9SS type A sorting domain-containing protein, partial [Ignavibacteriales bacterium]